MACDFGSTRHLLCYLIFKSFLLLPLCRSYQKIVQSLGILEKFPNKSIGICAQDPVYEEPLEEFKADFEDQYEYASEEIVLALPEPKESL